MRRLLLLFMVVAGTVIAAGCGNPSNSAFLSVDKACCTGCAACVRVCPSDAIRIISNKAVIDPTKCIECGNCIEACPVNAIY